jgi:hypothetical protein
MTPGKDPIRLVGELALLEILRQGKAHKAFPLVIEIQARQRACLRRVTISSVEEGESMIDTLMAQIKRAHLLVIIPGPQSTAVGLKNWTVNPSGFHSQASLSRQDIISRSKRVVA